MRIELSMKRRRCSAIWVFGRGETKMSDEWEQRRRLHLTELAPRIQHQQLSVVAIHQIFVTEQDVRRKLALDPDWTSLSMDYLLDITSNLFLIDVACSDIGIVKPQLSDTTQNNGAGQGPWNARFFDPSGMKLIGRDGYAVAEDTHGDGRVRFHMHYFDPCLELQFGDFPLELPKATPAPDWLNEVMPYEPPN